MSSCEAKVSALGRGEVQGVLDCNRMTWRREAAADLQTRMIGARLRLQARHSVHLLQVVVSEDAKRKKRQAKLKEGKRR